MAAPAIAALLAMAPGVAVNAEPEGSTHEVVRQSIDGGAQAMQGGAYVLTGVVGQPDAGTLMQGPIYSLRGGFFAAPALPRPDLVFADGFEP